MSNDQHELEKSEAELESVLRNFRQNVDAWSEAEYGRPRTAVHAKAHHAWRIAFGSTLACVLAVGGLSTALYQRHHNGQLARENAVHQGEQAHAPATVKAIGGQAKQQAMEQQIASVGSQEPDAGLLAGVDSDVSRQVSRAMEPLAQLMESDPTQ